jgi:hypothetical protein
MFKFIQKLVFKIPFIKREIYHLQNDALQWKNAHEGLRADYNNLRFKVDNQLFVYIDSANIWNMPEWTAIDGPMAGEKCFLEKGATKTKFFKFPNAEENTSVFSAKDFLEKYPVEEYIYFKIELRKGAEKKSYWKFSGEI